MEKLCNIFGFLGLMVAGQCVFGAIVPSLYDESSGKWIGDVDALTNAFANGNQQIVQTILNTL